MKNISDGLEELKSGSAAADVRGRYEDDEDEQEDDAVRKKTRAMTCNARVTIL